MEHAEARETLELAAAELGGLERLMAGDTAESASLAGHLVGCASCATEMTRLRHVARLLRGTVPDLPPPELKERTLAYVRAVGRDRSSPELDEVLGVSRSLGDATAAPVEPVAATASLAPPAVLRSMRGRRPLVAGWLGSLAAAVAVAVLATSALVGGARNAEVQRDQEVAAELASLNTTSLRLLAAPDAHRLELRGPDGNAAGTLIFAPSAGQLVVTATGLAQPSGSVVYQCWASRGGQDRLLGSMNFEDGLAYWIGPVQGLGALTSGTQFWVSRETASGSSGTSGNGTVVLSGWL